ncbi:hypothetical protein [Conexibacter arvalis]|uniref:Uncharacterized protein n=1 Tax=Conexibacter arvalis TaxID=912552 RepID=A0A840IGT1_9ACTN|nr:hypothetical protein [Conexibacter arvalis]MBB4663284.1 hypothetical protein [Conexibacter arvalis]
MTAGPVTRPALVRALAALCVALVAAFASASAAQADETPFGIDSFTVTQSTTQAGGHPDLTVRFEVANVTEDHPERGFPLFSPMKRPLETPRTLVVDLPPGLVGDPSAAPRCPAAKFAYRRCPPESQVGTIEVETFYFPYLQMPVYNLVPSSGAPAEFGFYGEVLPFHMRISVRDEDRGLRTTITTLPTQAPLVTTELTLWGVPADPAHDALRGRTCSVGFFDILDCPGETGEGNVPSSDPRRPFMTNAATCDGPTTARMAIETYQRMGRFVHAEASLPQLTGCERQRFAASATARPDTTKAGAPAGYAIELDVPQSQDPDGLATPPVKDVVVRLPQGTVVSPSTSDGLQTCADAAMKVETSEIPDCPPASKIGTVQIDTPLLARPLTGSVFLTEQRPERLLRMVLVAEEAGVRLKLPGAIDLDPATGQITATFPNNPQLAFNHLTVKLKGGPRAPLANPRTCGPATTTTTLVPYGGGEPAVSTDTFEVSCDGAPAGFAPGFSAGSASTVAGAASAFTLAFARGDGDDMLGSIAATLPAGLLPRLGTMPLCGEAQAAAGTCGEETRVGSAQVSVGPGELPYPLPHGGRVYVTGPYKGAPYGLSIVVPALAGPYDLGTVVVRAAVDVDIHTAALKVVSDPLPTILQGIPLQIRAVRVAIDRPGFMLNPTSCAPRAVTAAISSAGGATANLSSRYQVGGCKALKYTPKLAVKVGGKGRVGAGKATPLVATLTQPAGQAGNRRVQLALPGTINARLEVVEQACTLAEYEAGSCGEKAKIGSAMAVTPLLPNPLRGPAYFVRNPARRLPDIVVQLRGDVAFDLVGKIRISRDFRLVTNFDTIPDVPLSRFQLKLPAANSPVGTVYGLCTKRGRLARARQTLRAQNGKVIRRAPRLTIAGCAKKRK